MGDVHSMNKLEHLNAHVMMVQFLPHQEEDVDVDAAEDAVVVDEVETEEETVTETKKKMTMKKKEKMEVVEDVGVEVVEDEGIVEGEDEEINPSNEKGQ